MLPPALFSCPLMSYGLLEQPFTDTLGYSSYIHSVNLAGAVIHHIGSQQAREGKLTLGTLTNGATLLAASLQGNVQQQCWCQVATCNFEMDCTGPIIPSQNIQGLLLELESNLSGGHQKAVT